jgi:hypothetical protein
VGGRRRGGMRENMKEAGAGIVDEGDMHE